MIAKKKYVSPLKDEDAIPKDEIDELQADPFTVAVASVDEVDVDEEDGIDDGAGAEGEEDEESQLGAHGFHVVTGEEDDSM